MDYRRQAADNALNRGLQALKRQSGAAVLIVSHDLRVARQAYRMIDLVNGRVARAPAEEVAA